jgi:hypothetical protein
MGTPRRSNEDNQRGGITMKALYTGERDYSKFKIIDGNREVKRDRVEKIKESIKQSGFHGAIVCNEHLQVIDGQGRLKACEELNEPIDYIVEEGLTIEDCILMNLNTTPWKIIDYIKSYTDRGNENYIRLSEFLDRCRYSFATSMYAVNRTGIKNLSNVIKNGSLIVTDKDIEKAEEILEFWSNFDSIITNRQTEFYAAIAYCYEMDCVDNYRLVKKINDFPRSFTQIASITDAIDVIEDVYNNRIGQANHVYIETEYYKYLNKMNAGVGSAAKLRHNKYTESEE